MIQQSHFWDLYSKEMKTGYQKDTCIPMFTVLFTITKTEKPPKSINE